MILVCGANGLLGRAICERLPAEKTIAAVRKEPADNFFDERNIVVETADLSDFAACEALIAKIKPQVVVSVVGGKNEQGVRSDKTANINLIQAVEKSQKFANAKMVLVTSVGCGEQWELISPLAQQALGEALKAKTEAENYLKQSSLNWLIIRPGGLNNEPEDDKFQIVGELPKERKMYVSRNSVANAIVGLVSNNESHKVVSVISRAD